jgi:hypothetical protein
MHILHCPHNQTGHAHRLVLRERAAGHDSRLVTLAPEPFGFPCDETLARTANPARVELARFQLLWRALRWADVVHLNYGTPILRPWPRPRPPSSRARRAVGAAVDGWSMALAYRDLALLKRAGKRVVVTFEGSDCRSSRAAELTEDRHSREVLEELYPARRDDAKRRTVEALDRHVDAIFALTPDLLDHLPSRTVYVPQASVDPTELSPPAIRSDERRPLRIVHAPSDRLTKGSGFLIEAVEQLRAEGLQVELQLVERMPHDRALELVAEADVIVDQLIIGWYGVVSVEAMALGKPVLCYLTARALANAPAKLVEGLPVLRTSASTITEDLRALITTRSADLAEAGRRGRSFVETWHAPARVMAQVEAAYE